MRINHRPPKQFFIELVCLILIGLICFGIGSLVIAVAGTFIGSTDFNPLEVMFIGAIALIVIAIIVFVISHSVKKRRNKKNEKNEER